jgi:5-methylcytosine-specific restriction endonuclease McrA
MDSKYDTKEWKEKRTLILSRDNFTCQNCNTFDPSSGTVKILNLEDNSFELHDCDLDHKCIYTIASSRKGVTFEMDFGQDFLVLPVLQVHHKKYIGDREIWEYDDNDLITLCKKCHSDLHSNYEIPHFDSKDEFIGMMKHLPKDNNSGHKHGYEPWVFIHSLGSKNEYQVSNVLPVLKLLLFKDEILEEVLAECNIIMQDFFKKYLLNYKM